MSTILAALFDWFLHAEGEYLCIVRYISFWDILGDQQHNTGSVSVNQVASSVGMLHHADIEIEFINFA